MEIKIPKRFKLCGLTINVHYRDDLHFDEDVVGFAKYRQSEIILQANTTAVPRTREAQEQTYLHELMHHILYIAGEDHFDPPLHKREFLVDRIASLLHQALATSEDD